MPKAQEIDAGIIELSKSEKKILRMLLNNGMMPDEPLINEVDPYPYLYRTDLIEKCYSEKFPYEDPGPGLISIPVNAIRITDKGRIALRGHNQARHIGNGRSSVTLQHSPFHLLPLSSRSFSDATSYTPLQPGTTRQVCPVFCSRVFSKYSRISLGSFVSS